MRLHQNLRHLLFKRHCYKNKKASYRLGKILAKYILDKRLVSGIYEEFLQLDSKISNPIKKGKIFEQILHQRRCTNGEQAHKDARHH